MAETVDSGASTVLAIKQQSLPKLFHFLSCQMLWSDEHDENWRIPWKWSITFFISCKISFLRKCCEECHNRGFRGQTSKVGLMGISCLRLSSISHFFGARAFFHGPFLSALWPRGSRWMAHTIRCPLSSSVTQVLFPKGGVIVFRWWCGSAPKS